MENFFSHFRVSKIKFHHCWPHWKNAFRQHLENPHYCPLEKILSTPVFADLTLSIQRRVRWCGTNCNALAELFCEVYCTTILFEIRSPRWLLRLPVSPRSYIFLVLNATRQRQTEAFNSNILKLKEIAEPLQPKYLSCRCRERPSRSIPFPPVDKGEVYYSFHGQKKQLKSFSPWNLWWCYNRWIAIRLGQSSVYVRCA